jgi:hypothetical protein
MKLQGALLVFGLVATLSLGASNASAAKGKKKGEHTHHGTVVAVEKKGNEAVLTIATHHHNKKKGLASVTKTTTHKFEVDGKTTILTVNKKGNKGANKVANNNAGGKKQKQAGSLASLQRGDHVVIRAHNHHADTVAVHHKSIARNNKGKKKAAA